MPQSKEQEPAAIRNAYAQVGVEAFYREHGASYRNPHESAVRALLCEIVPAWGLDLDRVLDLACGSGEATLALRELGATGIEGVDPYTFAAFEERTGDKARPLSFEEIAAGALEGERYSLVVCSFALHLLEESRLPALCFQLARVSSSLLILTPHKRPALQRAWGWELKRETVWERVRARLYQVVVLDSDTP